MKRYKLIALIGAAGAGKDFLMSQACDRNLDLNMIISHTTRPPRSHEHNGINYFFVTDAEFLKQVAAGKMLEYTKFNDWYYGASVDALKEDAVNIGVFNPDGIRKILKRTDIDLTVFWIMATPKTRLLRQIERESNPNINEVCRRFLADETDFGEVDFDYIPLWNESPVVLEENIEAILSSVG